MRVTRFFISGSIARTVAFAGIVLLGSTRTTAASCVDVVLQFGERQPTPALVESMRKEASAIWARYRVEIGWPAADGTAGCLDPYYSFDVLVHHHRPTPGPKPVLGSTRLTPSSIRRTPVDIDSGATERLLEDLGAGSLLRVLGNRNVASVDLGRALGRVLAHEIGHVVLAAATHPSRGLMRKSFAADDLISPQRWSFTLSAAEVAHLREREVLLGSQTSVASPRGGVSTEWTGR